MKRKSAKLVKRTKIIIQQPKTLENPNFVNIESFTIEHSKTSRKLSKIIKQTKKVSQVGTGKSSNNHLYGEEKSKHFLNEKTVKITKRSHALKGNASSYNVEILNFFNPILQLKDAESAIKNNLIDLLTELKGLKFVTTLRLVFKKIQNDDKTLYPTFYFNWKTGTIINERDIDDVFENFCSTIISKIQKSLGRGSDWIIDLVIDHNINILFSSSYMKLPKELDHPRKGLINIQNIDGNECFKWCFVRYLNPGEYHPKRITKADEVFPKRLDFKDIKLSVKSRDIHKIEKKNSIGISVFGYENKGYCLQAFTISEKIKCLIKDCFKINGKQTTKMPKKITIYHLCRFWKYYSTGR